MKERVTVNHPVVSRELGKPPEYKRFDGDTVREATSHQEKSMHDKSNHSKHVVTDLLYVQNHAHARKKSRILTNNGFGFTTHHAIKKYKS